MQSKRLVVNEDEEISIKEKDTEKEPLFPAQENYGTLDNSLIAKRNFNSFRLFANKSFKPFAFFDKLPHEIILKIAFYLDLVDIVKFAWVSHGAYHIANIMTTDKKLSIDVQYIFKYDGDLYYKRLLPAKENQNWYDEVKIDISKEKIAELATKLNIDNKRTYGQITVKKHSSELSEASLRILYSYVPELNFKKEEYAELQSIWSRHMQTLQRWIWYDTYCNQRNTVCIPSLSAIGCFGGMATDMIYGILRGHGFSAGHAFNIAMPTIGSACCVLGALGLACYCVSTNTDACNFTEEHNQFEMGNSAFRSNIRK